MQTNPIQGETNPINLDLDQLKIVKDCLEEKMATLKNHIVSAVENPTHWEKSGFSAESMARNLRRVEGAFKIVNGEYLRATGRLPRD